MRSLIVAGVSAVIAASGVIAQQPTAADLEMMKTWSMSLTQDKLTDKRLFTATATVHAAENAAHVYQLVFKCDGEPREFALSTWDTTGAAAGMMNGRAMEWQTRVVQTGGEVTSRDSITGAPHVYAPIVQNEVVTPKAFRYRIDNAVASSSELTRVSDNVAHLLPTDLFVPPSPSIDSSGTLSAEQERALGRIAALSRGDQLTPMLPKTRLLLADVFPGETVEFPFDTLTPDARSALHKMCKFDEPITSGASTTPVPSPVGNVVTPLPPGVQQGGDAGVTSPVPLVIPKPKYTAAAEKVRIQGEVQVECIVETNGTCTDVQVIHSLDQIFGLDEEAVKSAKLWRFKPGMRFGEPVRVRVIIAVKFALR